MKISPYKSTDKDLWDQFVEGSKNGTFLFLRDYMDYHKDRFSDSSLFIRNAKNIPIALFPANYVESEKLVVSHGGLTYGSLLLSYEATAMDIGKMWEEIRRYYKHLGADLLHLKTIPYIYHNYPCEEELYWLFRFGAKLLSRGLSSVVDLRNPLSFSKLRKRKVKMAQQSSLELMLNAPLSYYSEFWTILEKVLLSYHNTLPVHSLEEILLLVQHFPQNIQLALVREADNVVAGCVQYKTKKVNHIQYIAASEEGRDKGALDFLFYHLIQISQKEGFRYVDFGISTEQDGHYLNEGLLFQKEGFGGRGICYDKYEINLND